MGATRHGWRTDRPNGCVIINPGPTQVVVTESDLILMLSDVQDALPVLADVAGL